MQGQQVLAPAAQRKQQVEFKPSHAGCHCMSRVVLHPQDLAAS